VSAPTPNHPFTGINQDANFLSLRETVESVVVAIVLALLFKTFIAEAFVIPTGSMAPTLMGRHVDTACPECKLRYQASASVERTREDARTGLKVVDTRCPNCGYRKQLDTKTYLSNDHSFSGDRIIVSKFAYEMREPERWDVIVFKYPEGAQQNYIKRLVGLPNETVRIVGGNLYTKRPDQTEFEIARKPPQKILSLLQIVHDSEHPSPRLTQAGWPEFWQSVEKTAEWKRDAAGKTFELAASGQEAWLRYHHVEPMDDVWEAVEAGERVDIKDWPGRLISDFYAYNCARQQNMANSSGSPFFGERPRDENAAAFGQHWVDDLAVECEAEITSGSGELLLDSVRAGEHFTCRVNTSDGSIKLTRTDREGKPLPFSDGVRTTEEAFATSNIRGPGKYRLRLSNVDHEIRLWVNETVVQFNAPTTYDSPDLVLPDIANTATGDLAPVGVGAKQLAVKFSQLKVLRDKYYIALERGDWTEYPKGSSSDRIVDVLADPTPETLFPLLRGRQTREIVLGPGHYMPLGDNSPASADARYWVDPYVERHLLVGRAVCIYWPHSWWQPFCWPNFERMKPIH
jgi:signal peptidase I